MTRIAITGGPRTGKTTLATKMCSDASRTGGSALRHTDGLIEQFAHLGKDSWSAASQHVVDEWFTQPGPWIVEGVAVSRALRKWRDQHPGEPPPVDRVVYLTTPREPLSKGQEAMAKGVRKVHDEIEAWLAEHEISTEYGEADR